MFIRVTFFIAAMAAPALAAQAPPNPGADTPAVVYPKVTEHVFRPESVDGRTQRPDGVTETARVRRPLGSLVRVRQNFRSALLQTAEDL